MRSTIIRIGLALACITTLGAQSLADEPAPLVITTDTQLDPQRTYGRIEIRASNVTLDGRGAWLIGATEGSPRDYQGTAILAENVSNVTLRNMRAKGWETGLVIRDGREWTIEDCDFSDNFHDPEFGWGENGRRGGILLERVSDSVLRRTHANRVWDACSLVECNGNRLEGNDFSHTSDTCLKLWKSSSNEFVDNNFSYGIRKNPGEVHVRDSTGVLIECGSNDNHFLRNDCTYGGDGIFIRVLNGWVSSGNVFVENDCSYANNNCVEAWAPRNEYYRNKANHGSYGFWLGASDQTVLVGNEASWNGLPDGNHNSPHLPDQGHAGIVFMFGPSSHTVARGNTCVGNQGAGIAVIGDMGTEGKRWRAYHWIIEQNRLEKNRWGVYLQYADWIEMAANHFQDNSQADVHDAGGVTRITRRSGEQGDVRAPKAKLAGPDKSRVGQSVSWDASASSDPGDRTLAYRWDFGDGTQADGAAVEHVYTEPGYYRLGLTINNGLLSDLAWRDVYVTEQLVELGTEGAVDGWSCIDPSSQAHFRTDRDVTLCGRESLVADVNPYGGGRATLACRLAQPSDAPGPKDQLVFWLQTRNENTPAWQGPNPIVTLVDVAGQEVELLPTEDFLSAPPFNEARDGWTYFKVPLAGNQHWKRTGPQLGRVQEIRFGVDSWGAPPLLIRFDGVAIQKT